MRPLLDLNVMLDLFLVRDPWFKDAAAIWDANRDGRIRAAFSSAAMPTLFYLLKKDLGTILANRTIVTCLNFLEMVPVSTTTLRLASMGPGGDFEDNLHIASAVEGKLDVIITRDAKGFVRSPILALTPTEFLARMTPAP